MAVGGGMRLVAVGGVIGVALAAALTWSVSSYLYGIGARDVVTFAAIPPLTWSVSSYLYGIGARDVVTFAAIPLILSGVAFLAAFVPARRAAAVDPVRALRSE